MNPAPGAALLTAGRLGTPVRVRHPPSLGELRARHREAHLCLKCNHHLVCGMARSLDANLLVTIASCLGFSPSADEDDVCELTPIEPLITP